MKIHEYQAKRIFERYGIPIPKGQVATTPGEAWRIAKELGEPVAVKAQVLAGGRGKAGGVRIARDADEAEQLAKSILGMEIGGLSVKRVLVDEAVDIAREIYLGLVIDRGARRVVMMASGEGGIEIEEIARRWPEKIITQPIDPFIGLRDYQIRATAKGIGLSAEHLSAFSTTAQGLYNAFVDSDASLAEINPLVVTADNKLIALDAKMVLDDNALFRHRYLADMRDVDEENPAERAARVEGLSYVKLDGEVGCMVNGAGLAMATMDMTRLYGGSPANFLDIGGGARAEKVKAALRIILSDPNVKSVLFNIFGGITRCDEVARGIVEALRELETSSQPMPTVPMVARLVGTNEAEARQILAEANLITATTLAEAAEKAVKAARGELVV